ncbi:MAG: asparagine synthase (glutamine-hydrolyzing) [Cyclobacteriaceae bacterium]|nr:asparagine synthase (glutamine-hydrolyzing) [Cyclobacteriaceae bacterium]
MCGITGIFAFNLIGKIHRIHVTQATMQLAKRGPDHQGIYTDDWVGLGHRRLSIIDTSEAANQPMWDASGRYSIIFNGEIFNFLELKQDLERKGISFSTHSDTEVLLQLLITEGRAALNKLNGFFAFCFYDKVEQKFLVARDRFGIKPLLYVFDDDKFIFASEMKSILAYGIDKSLDYEALHHYLHLNYIPAPLSIFKSVRKLLPGNYIEIKGGKMLTEKYYDIPYTHRDDKYIFSYEAAKEKIKELLEDSVRKRLVADVPLGCFLSGGIDSSIITGLAAKHKSNLHTFSIGFADESFFDETHYAKLVAKHFDTEHTVFSLTNKDLFSHLFSMLDYVDEPFADSSALNVFILSKETRKHATVALSGDGADEILGGYNKHAAFLKMESGGTLPELVAMLEPVWKALPKSRNGKLSNVFRQLEKFAEGKKLPLAERYWRFAGFTRANEVDSLLSSSSKEKINRASIEHSISQWTNDLKGKDNINEVLLTDTKFVLPNDMLAKVDFMSMANALEVRVPFLDYRFVDYVFSLPSSFKINKNLRKRVLQDAFRDVLPEELYNRPKKGFEVPLLNWLKNDLRYLLDNDLLSKATIESQGIFNYQTIEYLKKKLHSNNPGDAHARIWGLLVFQYWWKKYGS